MSTFLLWYRSRQTLSVLRERPAVEPPHDALLDKGSRLCGREPASLLNHGDQKRDLVALAHE